MFQLANLAKAKSFLTQSKKLIPAISKIDMSRFNDYIAQSGFGSGHHDHGHHQ